MAKNNEEIKYPDLSPSDISGLLRHTQEMGDKLLRNRDEHLQKWLTIVEDRTHEIFKYKTFYVNIPGAVETAYSIANCYTLGLDWIGKMSERSMLIHGIIRGKGLEEHTEEIMAGINNRGFPASLPNLPELNECNDLNFFKDHEKEVLENIQKWHEAAIDYVMNYIGRWEMYYKLFGGKNA